MGAIQYTIPDSWIKYDQQAIFKELTNAKAAIWTLRSIPFQRRWVDELQKIQLKMEVAGTSRIEGADFAANELDLAIKAETAEELHTRSQRQANAVLQAYKWIATLPDDMPINEELVCEIHRLVVTDCDDDHCAPGQVRKPDQNVTFGVPIHRGALGGNACAKALELLTNEAQTTFLDHDPLVQALAIHYHLAAMHPFLDGNGRTVRVVEALMLQRAGLKNCLFIAMSNFYYEEKRAYLDTLAQVRAANHDLTPFLKFGLRGVALQTERLTNLIRNEVSKEIFRNLMNELFTRLQSTRKRVIVKRQLIVLQKLLNIDGRIEFVQLAEAVKDHYLSRSAPYQAIARDLNKLHALGAIKIERDDSVPKNPVWYISVKLDWPSTITETEFFARLSKLPKSKTHAFLST